MKLLFFLTLFALIGASCNKNVTDKSTTSTNSQNTITATDTVKIPITDLGTGTYLGYVGGLYPNGANQPSGQYATDLKAIASSIIPLDSNGNSSSKGYIGFIAIGASTASIMMSHLNGLTRNNVLTNPRLRLAGCTAGGAGIEQIDDTTSGTYWKTVANKLAQNSLKFKQVEVIYLESEDSIHNETFPFRAKDLKTKYERALRIFKVKFPNIKLVYLLGRTTTFLPKTDKPFVMEPGMYYNGWACKFVVEDQIKGVPGVNYKGVNAVAPMATWGWYQWSIGGVPRKDGFVWTKDDTSDGLHANEEGAHKLSTRFQNFLLNDPYANIWYAAH